MHTTVIIPARYGSTRLPGKPLARIDGKPLIQYVYENALRADEVDKVIVATDHHLIYDAVKSLGGDVRMTSPDLPSGSDRIAAIAAQIETDLIINVQGDEPMLTPAMIDRTALILKESSFDIGTLARKIDNTDDIFNPNIVKVVFNKEGQALYFSRAPIPYYRDIFGKGSLQIGPSQITLYKHLGIYSYRRDVLLQITKLPQTELENAEKLEQLRAIENGFKIKVEITQTETIGVDTPADLERVKKWLNTSS